MGGVQLKAELQQLGRQIDDALLIAFAYRQQRAAALLHIALSAQHRFREGFGKGTAHAHHFTGGAHFRAENRIHALEFVERQHHLFHRVVRRDHLFSDALLGQRFARHHARRHFRQRHAGGFRDERHGARRARVDLNQVNLVVLHRELHVHQAAHVEFERQALDLLTHHVLNFLAQRVGGQRTGGVA